ncbi:hypothetical protein N8I77_007576 [Diaporthe amygdali]|uniref:Uncharacterized protein n=1 Tax=Phomopsis amygdali TaxID=1214568 RepID=A0AAD9SBH8_PHOAM|nr:hypothetical protein N8I77_007576 [Diaporthe amygdali]
MKHGGFSAAGDQVAQRGAPCHNMQGVRGCLEILKDGETVGQVRGSLLITPECPLADHEGIQPLFDDVLSFCRPPNLSFGSVQHPANMQLQSALALAAFATATLAQQCYYPSGKVGTADIPCSTSADNTHCCGKTGICLSNGYCMETSEDSGPLGLYRGSCTDRNWGSSCPQKCLGDNDFPADAARVARWKKNGTDWLYCCVGSDYDNDYASACSDDGVPFALPSASLIYGVAALSSAELISSTASSTATSATSASAATATSAAASSTATSTGDTCPDSGAQIGAIGAGVGASLGVLSISAIMWAFWERRQRLKAAAQAAPYSKAGYEAPGGFQYASDSTPAASIPSAHAYNAPIPVVYPHEMGPNEHKVELPGSITGVGSPRG